MTVSPLQLYKCLSDATRLSCVLLIHQEVELCVCELTQALDVSQPKISRHLAQLRSCGLLQDRREGQWIFYRIDPSLPAWSIEIIAITLKSNEDILRPLQRRLADMGNRPLRQDQYC